MVRVRSVDHALMREMNSTLILECLHRQAPLSRARLAQMTGMNKATVSSLVKELLNAGFVRENGLDSGDTGRPAIQLEINPHAGCILGAEVGVDFISVIATDFAANILWRRTEETARTAGQQVILERAMCLLQTAADFAADAGLAILGLGLGVPGLVDVTHGALLFAPNLRWEGVPLRHILEGRFHCPIYVDNEANLAALGESYFGAARDARFVLYLHSGVGLGGGIVLDGSILRGTAGLAGEIGHMTMDPDGPPCNCGNNGCWETYVSQWAVFQRVRDAVAAGHASSLLQATDGDLSRLTIPLIAAAADQGDAVAREALAETGRYLGIGLANLINALNPDLVVLGGILTVAHRHMLPAVDAVLKARALRWSRETTAVVLAASGRDACAIGAVASIYQRVLNRPLAAREPKPRPSAHRSARLYSTR